MLTRTKSFHTCCAQYASNLSLTHISRPARSTLFASPAWKRFLLARLVATRYMGSRNWNRQKTKCCLHCWTSWWCTARFASEDVLGQDHEKIWKRIRNGVASFIIAVGLHAVVRRRRARKSCLSIKWTASMAMHNALRAVSLFASDASLRITSTKTAHLSNKGDERRNCVKTNASRRLAHLRGEFYSVLLILLLGTTPTRTTTIARAKWLLFTRLPTGRTGGEARCGRSSVYYQCAHTTQVSRLSVGIAVFRSAQTEPQRQWLCVPGSQWENLWLCARLAAQVRYLFHT